MISIRRRSAALLVLAVPMLLLVAACGDGKDNGGEIQPFAQGPFSGQADKDWLVTFLDAANPRGVNIPDDTPGSIKDVIDHFFAEKSARFVLYAFLDRDKKFASSINVLGCEPPQSLQVVSDMKNMASFYNENGIKTEGAGTVSYNGDEYQLLRLAFQEGYDTYQTVLKTGECYTTATLTERAGDDKLDDFKQFLATLRIDPSAFPK